MKNFSILVAPMHVGSVTQETIEHVTGVGASVITFTEMMQLGIIQRLKKNKGYKTYVGKARGILRGQNPAHDCPIAVAKSVEVIAHGARRISRATKGSTRGSGIGMERWATWVVVQHPDSTRDLIIATHLNAAVQHLHNTHPRKKQYLKSINTIEKIAKNKQVKYKTTETYIAGDMNWPDSSGSPIRKLGKDLNLVPTCWDNIIWLLSSTHDMQSVKQYVNPVGSDHTWNLFTKK
jgi:hypothetical protein